MEKKVEIRKKMGTIGTIPLEDWRVIEGRKGEALRDVVVSEGGWR